MEYKNHIPVPPESVDKVLEKFGKKKEAKEGGADDKKTAKKSK